MKFLDFFRAIGFSALALIVTNCGGGGGGGGSSNAKGENPALPTGVRTLPVKISMLSRKAGLKSGYLPNKVEDDSHAGSVSSSTFYLYCPNSYPDGSAWYQTVTNSSLQIITSNAQGTAVTCQIAVQALVETGDSFAGTYTTQASGAVCGTGGSAPSSSCLNFSLPATGCSSNACVATPQAYTSGSSTFYVGASVLGPTTGNFSVSFNIGTTASAVVAGFAAASINTVSFTTVNGDDPPNASSVSALENKLNGAYNMTLSIGSCTNCPPVSGVGCKIIAWNAAADSKCTGSNTTKPSYDTASTIQTPASWSAANTAYNMTASNTGGVYNCTLVQNGSTFTVTTPVSATTGNGGWGGGTYSGSTFTPTADVAATPAFYKYPWIVLLAALNGSTNSYTAVTVCAQSP